ncbi:MAG: hypothetical protein DLM55_12295 [Acidimicrobiales bacterium]|nr:MAG: hypothetical protein DLM55_12295 [Acidimicrobiales bacterium]
MTTSLPIRFQDDLVARLRSRARRIPGATASGLAQLYVDEGMRVEEYPGIIFKSGPSGRRAALAAGPDVWEVIRAVSEIDERGEAAVEATAELLNLPESQVRLSMRYYADYPTDIDAEIARNAAEAEDAYRAWQIECRLVA